MFKALKPDIYVQRQSNFFNLFKQAYKLFILNIVINLTK